jgi:nitrite reductase/ring-hydroxylating ferredoxin subunit
VWTEVAKVGDVAVGGLKFVKLGGAQATLANCDGTFYAVGRRCGHMNAPLDQGSLAGFVLTCPLHFAQFDVRDGAVTSAPSPCRAPPGTCSTSSSGCSARSASTASPPGRSG